MTPTLRRPITESMYVFINVILLLLKTSYGKQEKSLDWT